MQEIKRETNMHMCVCIVYYVSEIKDAILVQQLYKHSKSLKILLHQAKKTKTGSQFGFFLDR